MIVKRMRIVFRALLLLPLFCALSASLYAGSAEEQPLVESPFSGDIAWDRHSLFMNGHRVCPVMGEIHYSRIPDNEWRRELRRMREGGVTLIATYVFWNHIEEREGIFDWTGQRSLRGFLELCKAEGFPVILRMGPFCHGEARCGGIPDWVVSSGAKLRSEDPLFMAYVERLYQQIYGQIKGLTWKEGGPVMGAQFDNEYRGPASYLLALKKLARKIGIKLPLYTRTGWPELTTPMPFGEMVPLYGDYADGFWDRSTHEAAGNYWKAFHFKAFRSSTAIATEQLGQQRERITKGDDLYPYFTCELGGGMMTSYHRRIYIYPEDALAMAVVKLGSGSNLLGYYMYHGGTNPDGYLTNLNECQATPATNHNDLPVKTYDFQAPLGEFGQTNETYYRLRPLHLFLQDFGELLAPMEANFPVGDETVKGSDGALRWSYRTMADPQSEREAAFVFFNNYERFAGLTAKAGVQFEVNGVRFPEQPVTIPASGIGVLPVNVPVGNHLIEYATAQLVAYRDGKLYMMALDSLPVEMKIDGKVMRNVKPRGARHTVQKGVYLLTRQQAEHLFLVENKESSRKQKAIQGVPFMREQEATSLRTIALGVQKVAESPTDTDFLQAAVYSITVPQGSTTTASPQLLSIDYRGDCARLYADGKLIADNFYNGRPFLFGLWRLPTATRKLELRILPLQPDAPIYFPREADTTAGEAVKSITLKPLQ